jgi:hypothetical protein
MRFSLLALRPGKLGGLAGLAGLTGIAGVGCTGTVSGSSEGADAESASKTSAVIVIERTADTTRGTSAEASARFIRVAAPSSPGDGLRAIGAALDLPGRGTCADVAARVEPTAKGAARAPVIELVDVGGVSLEAAGSTIRLLPRQLPDVTDVVSGVVYARAVDPSFLPAATRYVLHVAGGSDLSALDVAALAPADPGEVHVVGTDASDPQRPVVATGEWVNFSWNGSGTDETLYVDIRSAAGRPPVRCVFDDVGMAAVPTALFDRTGTLVVHRLRQEPLRARGIDSGEIRLDFARTLAYVRQ